MKKFKAVAWSLILVLAAGALLTACSGGLGGCTPDDGKMKINYNISPLADLTDFGTSDQYYRPRRFDYVGGSADDGNSASYHGTSVEKQYQDLKGKIAEEKTKFDNNRNRPESVTEETEQSTFQKIFAHATPDGILEALSLAALRDPQMRDLVTYMTKAGNDGFFAQYRLMNGYDKIMQEHPDTGSAEYQNAYKEQQKLRRTMLNTLNGIGMNGDEVGRVILQLSTYGEAVVKDTMMPIYDVNGMFTGEKAVDEYFKALEPDGLFDYDTLVFFRTNERLRGSMLQDQPYVGSQDARLVRAYAYLYQYEIAANQALDQKDFEKELDYRFKESLNNEEAVDYSRIKRINYAKGYRYSDVFYKDKFYPAVNVLEEKQERVEAEIYEINDFCKNEEQNGKVVLNGDGVSAESNMEIILGTEIKDGSEAALSAKMQLTGFNVATKDDLLAGDMQYWYFGEDNENYAKAVSMAAAQGAFNTASKGSNAERKAGSQFDLQMENLKATQFVLDQFISNDNVQGLSKSLVGQIYAVAADDIADVNQLKKDLVLMIKKYEVMPQGAEREQALYEIGRKNAHLKQLVNAALDMNSNKDKRIRYANEQANWANINTEVKAAIEADYSKYPVVGGVGGDETPRLNYMQFLLVKRYFQENNQKIDYIPGVAGHTPSRDDVKIEYNTDHSISQLFVNEDKVLYHTAGIIHVEFRKVGTVTTSTNGVVQSYAHTEWKYVDIQSGKTLKTGDGWKDGNAHYPLGATDETAIAMIRGQLPPEYTFRGWALDPAGYYKIDYEEEMRYDGTTFYAIFKAA